MSLIPYSQWLPFVQVNVAGCPKALMIEAIRQKAIEFCQRSRFWRKELDGFYTVANDEEYELSAPVDSVIADILLIKVNKCELIQQTQDDLETRYKEWREVKGQPIYFFLKDTSTAILVPIPDAIYPVRLLVSLKPSQAAQGVDAIVFEEYKDVIKHGALAYLCAMQEKEWSNANMVSFYQAQFEAGLSDAKKRAEHGYAMRKTFRVKPHYF